METFTVGIAKIELGAIGVGGIAGTVLSELGFTSEKSFKWNQPDGTKTEFRAEERVTPVLVQTTPGTTSFDWDIMNPGIETLQKVFGGLITGAAPNRIWGMPRNIVPLEQTVKVTPLSGLKAFVIPRGYVSAKFAGDLTREGLFMISMHVDVLDPADANTLPITVAE